MKKRNDFPDFVPENDDFAYQDGHPDDLQGDDPDKYDPNWADDDAPVEVAGQADMFAHEDFWNASADDSEALPEEEKVYKHSIFKPEMKKPNFVLSIAVNVIRIFAVLVLVAGLVWFYSGERGGSSKLEQWAFYWFYPAHIFVLGILTNLLLF